MAADVRIPEGPVPEVMVGSHGVSRRARLWVLRIVAALTVAFFVLMGFFLAAPYQDGVWLKCIIRAEEDGRRLVRPEWSSWPPGWYCVYRNGTQNYIGF